LCVLRTAAGAFLDWTVNNFKLCAIDPGKPESNNFTN
jgi:hypothetical protein